MRRLKPMQQMFQTTTTTCVNYFCSRGERLVVRSSDRPFCCSGVQLRKNQGPRQRQVTETSLSVIATYSRN